MIWFLSFLSVGRSSILSSRVDLQFVQPFVNSAKSIWFMRPAAQKENVRTAAMQHGLLSMYMQIRCLKLYLQYTEKNLLSARSSVFPGNN